MPKICLGIAVVSLVVGLAMPTHEIVNGLGKAMFGVFFILFFIAHVFGEKNA
jgi:hypothetical protein